MTTLIAGSEPRKSRALLVRESAIERTCTEILEWDGWRAFKMEQNFSEKKQKRTGEAGMPDHLYVRYLTGKTIVTPRGIIAGISAPMSEVLWIEWKSLDGKLDAHQQDWILAERKRGAFVLVAGIDFFPASIEGFKAFYAASGLQRSTKTP